MSFFYNEDEKFHRNILISLEIKILFNQDPCVKVSDMFPNLSLCSKIKTLSDMTEEEIKNIEKTYNAKIIRRNNGKPM